MTQVLEKLFNSKTRVRILRFFLRNASQFFDMEEISKRTKLSLNIVKSEIKTLESIEFIKSEKKADNKAQKQNQQKIVCHSLNLSFKLFKELEALVFGAGFINKEELAEILSKVGKVRFAAVSGVFLNAKEPSRQGYNRVDLFLIADAIDKTKLKAALQNIEAEIGKEIVYSVLSTEEFNYRKDMYDKFVYDILEGPREDLINKMKL